MSHTGALPERRKGAYRSTEDFWFAEMSLINCVSPACVVEQWSHRGGLWAAGSKPKVSKCNSQSGQAGEQVSLSSDRLQTTG